MRTTGPDPPFKPAPESRLAMPSPADLIDDIVRTHQQRLRETQAQGSRGALAQRALGRMPGILPRVLAGLDDGALADRLHAAGGRITAVVGRLPKLVVEADDNVITTAGTNANFGLTPSPIGNARIFATQINGAAPAAALAGGSGDDTLVGLDGTDNLTGGGGARQGAGQPTASRAATKASTQARTSASEWAADSCTRIRAFPLALRGS